MRKTRKRAAVLTAAMLAVSMTAGVMAETIPYACVSVMTASAASNVKVTVSAEGYGLVTPAQSVTISRGSTVVKSLTWDEFVDGVTVNTPEDTNVVIVYDDGILILNAVTGDVVTNTRTSGISREKFYFKATSLDAASSGTNIINPNTGTLLWVMSTQRNAETGDAFTYIGCEVGATASVDTTGFLNEDGSFNADYRLEFDYTEGTEIYVAVRPTGARYIYLYKYDMRSSEIVSGSYAADVVSCEMGSEWFPNESGFTSVEVIGAGLYNNYTPEKGTYLYADGASSGVLEKAIFTAEEWNEGNCYVGVRCTPSTVDVSNLMRVRFIYDDGYVEYSAMGTYQDSTVPLFTVLNESTRPYETAKDTNGDDLLDLSGNKIYEGTVDGIPAITDEALGTEKQDYEYTVELYKGAELIDTLSKATYEKTVYTIDDYDADAHYYARVIAENGTDSTFYRFYPTLGAWIKRVDTAETPVATIGVDKASFPAEQSGGKVTYSSTKTVASWDDVAFTSGSTTFSMSTKDCFSYAASFDGTSASYVYVGIDPELYTSGTSRSNTVTITFKGLGGTDIPVSPENPIITIEGVTEDGNAFSTDVYPIDGSGDVVVELPDGEYKIISPDTGLYDTVVVDADNSVKIAGSIGSDGTLNSNNDETGAEKGDDPTVNLTTPIEYFTCTLTAPDGTVIGTVEVTDGELDSTADLSGLTLPNAPYYGYSYEKGIANSASDNAETDNGYLVVDEDGSIQLLHVIKGDVNLDGRVNVADAVMLQRYLLNTLDEEFGIENFIAADVVADCDADAFDLCYLKKMLLA